MKFRQLKAVPDWNERSSSRTQMIWAPAAMKSSSSCTTELACERQSGHHAGIDTKSKTSNGDQSMLASSAQGTFWTSSGTLLRAKSKLSPHR